MGHHAAIDVALEWSSVCVVDAAGQIVREAKVRSEREALVAFVGRQGKLTPRVASRRDVTRQSRCRRRGVPVPSTLQVGAVVVPVELWATPKRRPSDPQAG
jgi:hypothetical protein